MGGERYPGARLSSAPEVGGVFSPRPLVCREGCGVRLFSCTYYDCCLDQAAKGMWTGFTCSGCFFHATAACQKP